MSYIIKYLHSLGYQVNKKQWNNVYLPKTKDHPIGVIKESLAVFNIESHLVNIPSNLFDELPRKFLAIVTKQGVNHIVLVDNSRIFVRIEFEDGAIKKISKEKFLQLWSGIALVAEKNLHQGKYSFLKGKSSFKVFIVSFLPIGIFLGLAINLNFLIAIYFLLSFIGLIISYKIIEEYLGLGNAASRFCILLSEKFKCQEIYKSSKNVLLGYQLNDLSIVYFSYSLIISFFLNIVEFNFFTLLVSIGAIGVSFYSLYIQGFILKKWCPLCLGIASIVSLHFVLILYLYNYYQKIDFLELSFPFLIFLLILIGWKYVRKFLQEWGELRNDSLELKKLIRKPDVFKLLLDKSDSVEGLSFKDNSLSLGNINSPVIINCFLSLHCTACEHKFEEIIEFLNYGYLDFHFRIFIKESRNMEKLDIFIMESMRKHALDNDVERNKMLLSDWYLFKSTRKSWLGKWGVENIEKNISKGKPTEPSIKKVPTLLLHNDVIPDSYSLMDLLIIAKGAKQ
ncbi:MAG: vitamin K epoxide reductase family protein [Salegentibacter mishustinae]|nr:vitamin K epoxide reductase family protein [Salegentibacter mishustinae]